MAAAAGAGGPGEAAASAGGANGPADRAQPLLPPMVQSLGRRVVAAEVARLAAHEINNHLQGIIGLADLLAEEVTEPGWKASLIQIKEQGEKIAHLQRNLGLLLRAGEKPVDALQPVDLGGLWQRVDGLFRGALTRRQAQVQIAVAASLPACLGDPDALTQMFALAALWHLKSLDRRADWSGAKPEFSLKLAPATTAAGGAAVEWHSQDNGAGVPAVMKPAPAPEANPELYDALSTLGLVQLVATVHRHAGVLATRSEATGGLELRITLPAAR